MKFKKILALSLVATVITTGIPNIEMFNRVENVLAADAIAPGESIVLDGKDYCELRDTLELKNIGYDTSRVIKCNNQEDWLGVSNFEEGKVTAGDILSLFNISAITSSDPNKEIKVGIVDSRDRDEDEDDISVDCNELATGEYVLPENEILEKDGEYKLIIYTVKKDNSEFDTSSEDYSTRKFTLELFPQITTDRVGVDSVNVDYGMHLGKVTDDKLLVYVDMVNKYWPKKKLNVKLVEVLFGASYGRGSEFTSEDFYFELVDDDGNHIEKDEDILPKATQMQLYCTNRHEGTSIKLGNPLPIEFVNSDVAALNGKFTTSDGREVDVNTTFKNSDGEMIGNSRTFNKKDVKPSAYKTLVNIDGQDATYGKDYTIKYYETTNSGGVTALGDEVTEFVNAGNYMVVVEGLGEYAGSKAYYDFEVKPMNVENYACEVIENVVGYTGNEIVPSIAGLKVGGNPLSSDDCVVEYADSSVDKIRPGKKKITVKLVGNYTGTIRNNYLYVKKALSSDDVIFYKNSEYRAYQSLVVSGQYKLIRDREAFSLGSSKYDYKISSDDKGNPVVVPEEDSGYYNTVGGNILKYSTEYLRDTQDFSIAKNNYEIIVGSVAEYTGKPIEPEIIVRDANKKVIPSTNYKVVYANNVNVANDKITDSKGQTVDNPLAPTIYVVGQNDYCGIMSSTFSIISGSIKDGLVDAIKPATYTGQSHFLKEKDIVVRDSEGNILKDSDYTIANYYKVETDPDDGDLITSDDEKYEKYLGYKVDTSTGQTPTDAGTYVVEVALAGNYANSSKNLYQTYTIEPASISTGFNFTTGINGNNDDFKVAYTGKIINASDFIGEKVVKLDEDGEEILTLYINKDYTIDISKDAKEAGEYNGTVKGTNNYIGEIPFTFNIVKTIGDVDIAFDAEETKVNDKVSYSHSPVALVKEKVNNSLLAENTDYEVSYYFYSKVNSKDKADFTIDGQDYALVGGKASSFKSGQDYVAVVNGVGDYEGTKYVFFTVPDASSATSVKDATITFTKNFMAVDKYSSEYTSKPVTVGKYGSANAIAVRVGNKLLVQGTDFEITYNNNINVSKDAEVVIVGKGKYFGTVSAKFEITQKVMSNSSVDVSTGASTSVGSYCYTGNALNASIKVKDKALGILTEGEDYTISYANIVPDGNSAKKDSTGAYIKGDAISHEDVKGVGSYLVVIKGVGNYTGEVTQLVKINKLNLAPTGDDVTIKGNDMAVTGSAITPEFTFINKADGSEFSIDASNYTLKLYADKACKEPLDSVTEVGTYYAKLKGTGNATGTSDAIEFNVVEGKDITYAKVTVLDKTFNPKLIVSVDGTVLKEGSDYTVEYAVADDGKSGIATITGAGQYTGTITATYEIEKEIVALSKASVKLSKTSYSYNGKSKKPDVIVKVNGVTVSPSEYTVAYSNNKNAGTGKVIITANDDSEVIKGSKVLKFTIAKAANKITAGNITKSYKTKSLKTKKSTFKLSAKTKAGKISYKKLTNSKKIAVSSKGTVTVAKGLKKGTYKVRIKIATKGSANYKAASKTITLTVKVK